MALCGLPCAAAQSTPNRAAEYAFGERPWLQCGVEQTFEVDFEGTGRPYRAEWRRCGPRHAEWKPDRQTIDYPTHFVTVTRNAAAATPLAVFDNAGEPGLSYIQSVQRMQFTGDGRQQLAVVTGIYGTGAAWELCVLGLVGGTVACWELPNWGPSLASLMAPDEETRKTLLRSVADDRVLVEALIYDKNRDANCCPSRASIFVELRPANGRLVLGNAWRLPPGNTAGERRTVPCSAALCTSRRAKVSVLMSLTHFSIRSAALLLPPR
jgi:hypothetical protein